VPNWRAEAARFAPELKVISLHGTDRAGQFAQLATADLALTTYALLPRDEAALQRQHWYLVILDEAQAIKNPAARATLVACRLTARHRLCLTGTPVENHLGDIWSQFAFLMPGLLGEAKRFTRLFRTPIERKGDAARQAVLARRLKPFILRRAKGEVATELPDKTLMTRHIELGGEQRDLYETVRLAMHEKVRAAVAARGLARSHIVILDALLKLRQVCCDPRLVKLGAARRVVASAKLAHLKEMLPELVEEGRRILLFSQFTSMLDLIEAEVTALGIPYVDLRGDTKDRATPVARFQRGEVPLFCLSLKAGGMGLNLTAADTVIHYDPWWNPAVEAQATDRAHRIGQDKPVFVYKLIAETTIEQRMLELQDRKAALANGLFDPEAKAGSFEAADLELLFQPLA
jgi:SNF2 family DNA or RNA helicase